MVTNINTCRMDGGRRACKEGREQEARALRAKLGENVLWDSPALISLTHLSGYMTADFSSSSFFVYISPNCAHTEYLFQIDHVLLQQKISVLLHSLGRISSKFSELIEWAGGDLLGVICSIQGKLLLCPKIVPWPTHSNAWHSVCSVNPPG